MLWKIALAIGGVVVVGIIIIALMGGMPNFLVQLWDWIFTTVLKLPDAPPVPFSTNAAYMALKAVKALI